MDRIWEDLGFKDSDTGLTTKQKKTITKILADKREALSLTYNDLAKVKGVTMKIPTGDAAPICVKSRPVPPHLLEVVDNQVKRWISQGVAAKQTSPWGAPLVIVPKANRGWRLAVDFRALNAVTEGDARNVANISEQIAKVRGDPKKPLRFFASIDLSEAFHSVPIEPTDVPKTGFWTTVGQCMFLRMPFGLKSAPATFHEVVMKLTDLMKQKNPGDNTLAYFDDLLLTESEFEPFIHRLKLLLDAIIEIGLKIQVRKANFSTKGVKWLGHQLSAEGLKPDPDRMRALKEWPTPKTVRDVAGLFGLCQTFAKWIPLYAQRVKNMRQLLKKGQTEGARDFKSPIEWTEEAEQEKKDIIDTLTSEPIMGHVDISKEAHPLILTCDTSKYGIGATLSQYQDDKGKEVIISYNSQKLTETQATDSDPSDSLNTFPLLTYPKPIAIYTFGT